VFQPSSANPTAIAPPYFNWLVETGLPVVVDERWTYNPFLQKTYC